MRNVMNSYSKQGLVMSVMSITTFCSLNDKASYFKIAPSIEAVRFIFRCTAVKEQLSVRFYDLNKQSRGFEALWHDDVIKWKHFPRHWPFVRGIHRSPVNSPHKGEWRRALMFSLICAWINGTVNNREARDLRRYRAHNDVTVMKPCKKIS